MRIVIIISLVLISLPTLSQDNPIDDVYSYLDKNKKDLVFTFSVKDSDKNIILTDSNGKEVSSKLIEILFSKGVLNYHSTFMESESNTDQFIQKYRNSHLTIRVEKNDLKNDFQPLLILVTDSIMTENLFKRIEEELKIENQFNF